MSSTNAIPSTCRALVLRESGKLAIENVPTPQVTPGSAIVKVLLSGVGPGQAHMVARKIPGLYTPDPVIPGGNAIGRIAAVGPDTTTLKVGQLVMLDPFIRGRDNPDVQMLWGLGVFGDNPAAKKLMDEAWKDGMFTEYTRAPIENCYPLDEKRLCGSPSEGGLGYSHADLVIIGRQLVAYGGFKGINLQAGETVVIAPATGSFSGAAVDVAVAMGARVIAMGRNVEILKKLQSVYPSINIVPIKNNVEEDLAALKAFGTIDAFLDISPHMANDSSHVRSCFMALKPYGRASLMGVLNNDIAIPYFVATIKNITIRGQYMYEKEDARGIIKLVESGVLKLGKEVGHEVVATYKFEEWEKALDTSSKNPGAGKIVVFEN
ncbi:chaperonin 10-like protein [Xylogone sp. PMI_703]|nr:chaperonin 10-like protein [Xylogone sp. PMI_703]